MGENLDLKGRDAVRTPMQWNDDCHGGFTTAEQPVVPIIADGAYGFQRINVSHQRREPESLLNWTERIIRLRKELPEIGYGAFDILDTGNEVLALRYKWKGAAILIAHNFTDAPCAVRLDLNEESGEAQPLVNLLSHDHLEADEAGGYPLVLEPYGYRWFRIGQLSEGLARDDR
jgi:maltose alpha-D-glucosyltransferase / alpha-amylase